MSRHSFRRTRMAAQVDGSMYIVYVMDDYGNDVLVQRSKVNHFIGQGR